jgi:hypothetical protein
MKNFAEELEPHLTERKHQEEAKLWHLGKMGTWKGGGNHSPPKNKLAWDSEGKEENGCPVQDSNKTKINYPKEPNKAQRNNLKEEILWEITENFMEMLLDKVNQNLQEALKKIQDNRNKEY